MLERIVNCSLGIEVRAPGDYWCEDANRGKGALVSIDMRQERQYCLRAECPNRIGYYRKDDPILLVVKR